MKKLLSVLLVALMVFSVFVTSASAATYTESESNDTFATANNLTVGNSVTGSMSSWRTSDFYKIVAPSNGKLSLVFKHDFIDSDNGWKVLIYYYDDGNYIELSSTRVDLNDGEKTNLPTLGMVKNGVYYIEIKCRTTGEPQSNYTLSTSFNSTNYYEKETNDTFQTATEVDLNNQYGGVTSNCDRADFFKIKATSNGKLTISFKHTYKDSNDGWKVSVYVYKDGKYTELSYNRVSLYDSEKIDLPIIDAEKNEVYYLKISQIFTSFLYDEYQIIASMSGSTSKTYKLSYNANGGSGAPSAQTGKTTYTISSTEPTRSGYEFLGWSTSSSASYASYESGDKITLSKDTTLYAVWEEISSGGGSSSETPDGGFDFNAVWDAIWSFFMMIINFIIDLFS